MDIVKVYGRGCHLTSCFIVFFNERIISINELLVGVDIINDWHRFCQSSEMASTEMPPARQLACGFAGHIEIRAQGVLFKPTTP
jgi:hypothetical protein